MYNKVNSLNYFEDPDERDDNNDGPGSNSINQPDTKNSVQTSDNTRLCNVDILQQYLNDNIQRCAN